MVVGGGAGCELIFRGKLRLITQELCKAFKTALSSLPQRRDVQFARWEKLFQIERFNLSAEG